MPILPSIIEAGYVRKGKANPLVRENRTPDSEGLCGSTDRGQPISRAATDIARHRQITAVHSPGRQKAFQPVISADNGEYALKLVWEMYVNLWRDYFKSHPGQEEAACVPSTCGDAEKI